MASKPFTAEKKVFAQVRFFEELYIIKDQNGETLFTGTEEMRDKILKLLNRDRKSGKGRKRKARRTRGKRK